MKGGFVEPKAQGVKGWVLGFVDGFIVSDFFSQTMSKLQPPPQRNKI